MYYCGDDSDDESCCFSTSDSEESYSDFSSDDEELTFREKLMNLFIDLDIEQSKGTAILKLLRTHRCFEELPADHRTLVKTPRKKMELRKVEPGEYLHLGIDSQITNYLNRFPTITIEKIIIDISTDGANMDQQGTIIMWPIQVKIVNIEHSTPIIVGIYRGTTKPESASDFFSDFISEWKKIEEDGGIEIGNKRLTLSIRCVIADAPARAFLLNHKGHRSPNGCSKCTSEGILRTDEDYAAQTDKRHHHGPSPLTDMGIRLVFQVPLEWLHLTLLGTGKRQTKATTIYERRFNAYIRLDNTQITIINKRLKTISEFTPREFARRPTDIMQCHRMKGTEIRQLILYIGPAVNHGVYKRNVFEHYLLHHTALRCLASKNPLPFFLSYAEVALQQWVKGCATLYGEEFVTYNTHSHLHLTEDVRNLGPLDSFSAFPYENHMQYLRKMCRKPGQPLQQIGRRIQEKANRKDKICDGTSIKPSQPHTNGPIPDADSCTDFVQYHLLKTTNFTLGTNQRDNCCFHKEHGVCLVKNIIAVSESQYMLVVQKFQNQESWYNAGIPSAIIGSYKCSNLHPSLFFVHFRDITAKCFRTPFWPLPGNNQPPPMDPLPEVFVATVMLSSGPE